MDHIFKKQYLIGKKYDYIIKLNYTSLLKIKTIKKIFLHKSL